MKPSLYAVALAALACISASHAETRYAVVELKFELDPDGYYLAAAISEGGLIAANDEANTHHRSFTCHWKNRCRRAAPLAGGEHISDLNDTGMAAGHTVRSRLAQAVVWIDGAPLYIGNADRKIPTSAEGVNSAGVVVGWEMLSRKSFDVQGFVWKAGVRTRIGALPGGSSSYLWGINDAGVAVGKSETITGAYHAFTYDTLTGAFTDLGTLPRDHDSKGLAINAAGDIAGISGRYAVRTVGGVMQSLGVLPGYHDSIAYGINDRGETVGTSADSAFSNHGFIYDDDGMHDLNDMLVDTDRSRYVVRRAVDINNNGDIAAEVSSPERSSIPVILKRLSR